MNARNSRPLMEATILLFSLILSSCGLGSPAESENPNLDLMLDVDPNPPVIGPSHLVVTLVDSGGALIDGATVNVEGSMPEGEMQPLFASLRASEDGKYESPFSWTMGGDWIMIVDATLADGQEISRQFELAVSGEMDAGHSGEDELFHPPRVANKGAVIHLLAPSAGAAFEPGEEIRVAVEFENFELAVDSNHWHIYDNGRSARMVMGDMNEANLPGLEPGEHEISVYMSIGSHEELEEAASATITVRDTAD